MLLYVGVQILGSSQYKRVKRLHARVLSDISMLHQKVLPEHTPSPFYYSGMKLHNERFFDDVTYEP